jgi:serine kinase of HPr protein (carbohydrate metabolism regulator)
MTAEARQGPPGQLLHATAVVLDGSAVLITGPPGSGKSDLALRLIDRGALLLADDYLHLRADEGRLVAQAPEAIAGLIEVRGLGIIRMRHSSPAPVGLVVAAGTPERMPEAATTSLLGIDVPLVVLSLLEASAPLKLELALRRRIVPLEGSANEFPNLDA